MLEQEVSEPSQAGEKKGRQSTVTTSQLNLRAGDWVEVRSADEILGTLDAEQALEGLPFMPEMLQYCGRKFRVYKTAHKTCDTINNYAIRRMAGAVHLQDLRCDGEAHAGCQAGCLLFWKEAWLKRSQPDGAAPGPQPETTGSVQWTSLMQGTRVPVSPGEPERFRCQATDLLKFTTEVRRRGRWDPRLYVKDLTGGNVTLGEFVKYGLFAMVNAFTERWLGYRYPHLCGRAGKQTPTAKLDLQAGELVRVRSRDEIMATLGPNMKNRGLHFDVEMAPFCATGERVLKRVERIVDEKTGLLVELPNPCLILDGVTCSGLLSSSRMFCPRNIYPFWREVWLKRVDDPSS